jgi:xanthine dehydrogenase/oxidase
VYAAKKVVVQYEDLPAIISMEDAIAANSIFECFPPTTPSSDYHEIVNANQSAFEYADILVEGTAKIGGQEHFYLETNSTVVIPVESGSLEIVSSTQNPSKTQKFCAHVCGLPASREVGLEVKRRDQFLSHVPQPLQLVN